MGYDSELERAFMGILWQGCEMGNGNVGLLSFTGSIGLLKTRKEEVRAYEKQKENSLRRDCSRT